MKTARKAQLAVALVVSISCSPTADREQLQAELKSINLLRGDIALCTSDEASFGEVEFGLSCAESVRSDFNLATALLHSFEYAEAEKVFARVIDADPECLMGYWGVAMSNFHPLWAPPTEEELEKGAKTIALARRLDDRPKRESDYLEAVAVIYDNWEEVDHRTRLSRFEQAAEKIYRNYPDDKEAAIFYALALRAAADPADKTFARQKKAGEILNALFAGEPNHPGIAHYLIHTYDYPELATLALPAARKYASIAAGSAHALHMPSHIFTRLGLWDEAIRSNINSVSAAKCYAENSGMKGHWDEELHGIDYLVYAYLQQGKDQLARQQVEYLSTIEVVFPLGNKNAYTFAAVPVRYALERKDWALAASQQLTPRTFPWDDFPWERSLNAFGNVIGAAHTGNMAVARSGLVELRKSHTTLQEMKRGYEAGQVLIQIKASEAWISLMEGKKSDAVRLMAEAADMEDATEKHPVTPGEVLPARELLADMLLALGDPGKALTAYEQDLQRRPGRFNALYGAALAAQRSGNVQKANLYFGRLLEMSESGDQQRRAIDDAKAWLRVRG